MGSVTIGRMASKRGEQTGFTTKSLNFKTIRFRRKRKMTASTLTVLTRNMNKFKSFKIEERWLNKMVAMMMDLKRLVQCTLKILLSKKRRRMRI